MSSLLAVVGAVLTSTSLTCRSHTCVRIESGTDPWRNVLSQGCNYTCVYHISNLFTICNSTYKYLLYSLWLIIKWPREKILKTKLVPICKLLNIKTEFVKGTENQYHNHKLHNTCMDTVGGKILGPSSSNSANAVYKPSAVDKGPCFAAKDVITWVNFTAK